MKNIAFARTRALCLSLPMAVLVLAVSARAALIHRYSFTSDASDSVGGANGTVNSGVTFSNGQAFFDGTTNGFIQLPPDLLTNLNSVTFEVWETDSANSTWARLFNFGNGTRYWMAMIPHDGVSGAFDGAFSTNGGPPTVNGQAAIMPLLPTGSPEHVVFTVDGSSTTARIFQKGVQKGVNTNFTLTPAGVYAAAGSTPDALVGTGPPAFGDPTFTGSVDELRIYDAALSPLQIAVDTASGPNNIVTNTGALQSLALALSTTNTTPGGVQYPAIIANFANVTNVNLAGFSALTFTSSAPSVASVVFGQTIGWTLNAVGVGTATVTASYQGKSASGVVTVNPNPTVLIHRYGFTNDASDSVGGANGTTNGGVTFSGGQAVFDGLTGYIQLPPDMLTNVTSVTFEVWETANDSGLWERLYNFGNGTGKWMTMIVKDGVDASLEGAFTENGGPPSVNGKVAATSVLPPIGVEQHLVFTVNAPSNTAALYVNGPQVGFNNNFTYLGAALTPQAIGTTPDSWMGKSPFSGDPFFNGSIDEFRIYNGVLAPLQIAVDAVTGPDNIVTNIGALQTLTLTLGTTNMTQGDVQFPAIMGTFANVTNVNLSGVPTLTFTSSVPSIVSVTFGALGWQVSAPGGGTATITASYQGQSASKVITVIPHPTALIHRYGFTNDASDSIGGANGTLNGNAAISGGMVTLDGTNSYVALPPDMITNLTSVTFEVWETDSGVGTQSNGSDTWGRVFSFGNVGGSGGPAAWIDLIPHNGSDNKFEGAATEAGGPPDVNGQVVSTSLQPAGIEQQVVFTVNASSQTAMLFINGLQAGVNTDFAHNGITMTPAVIAAADAANGAGPMSGYLGISQYSEPFGGSIDEFRIYDGVLSPLQIAVDAATGPDNIVTNIGALQTLTLTVATNHMNVSDTQNAAVSGHFANVSSNVNLTTVAAYSSSTPGVATVDTVGLVSAVGTGFTVLSASLSGVTNSVTISAGVIAPPTLTIRRSGNNVILSWPDSVAGFVLKSTAAIGPAASWSNFGGTPADSGGMFSQTVPISGATKFFRLTSP